MTVPPPPPSTPPPAGRSPPSRRKASSSSAMRPRRARPSVPRSSPGGRPRPYGPDAVAPSSTARPRRGPWWHRRLGRPRPRPRRSPPPPATSAAGRGRASRAAARRERRLPALRVDRPGAVPPRTASPRRPMVVACASWRRRPACTAPTPGRWSVGSTTPSSSRPTSGPHSGTWSASRPWPTDRPTESCRPTTSTPCADPDGLLGQFHRVLAPEGAPALAGAGPGRGRRSASRRPTPPPPGRPGGRSGWTWSTGSRQPASPSSCW